MTLEEIKTTVLYIQGLQALWKEDYNAEKIGDYTFSIVCRDYNTTDELWEVINVYKATYQQFLNRFTSFIIY